MVRVGGKTGPSNRTQNIREASDEDRYKTVEPPSEGEVRQYSARSISMLDAVERSGCIGRLLE